MPNRTKSSRQRPLKRSKLHSQTESNRGSNRATSAGGPNVQSLSVSQAAVRLGVSVSTVKRMVNDGKLASFRTGGPLSHLRIPVEAVERQRQTGDAPTAPTAVLSTKRAHTEELRADLETRKLEREVRKLDAEDAAAERARRSEIRAQVLAQKRALVEAKLQRERLAQQKQREELEQEHKDWHRRWARGARNTFPKWISDGQEQTLATAVEVELMQWDPTDSEEAIGEALERTINRMVAPWESERDAQRKRDDLIQSIVWRLPLGATDAEKISARVAVRDSLAGLPLSASDLEMHSIVNEAVAPVRRAIEERIKAERDEAQAAAARRSQQFRDECSKIQRQQKKASLIQSGMIAASLFLFDQKENGPVEFEDDEEFWKIKSDVEATIKETLEQELTGDEESAAVDKTARQLADELLDEHCED